MGAGKNALISVIYSMIGVFRHSFRLIPVENILITSARRGIKHLQNNFRSRVTERVHQAIDQKETLVRRLVVGKVAEATCTRLFTLISHGALQAGIGGVIYLFSRQGMTYLSENEGLSDTVVKVIAYAELFFGGYLWVRCITPTLEGLHEDYQMSFDPNASTLKELSKLIRFRHLSHLFQYIKLNK